MSQRCFLNAKVKALFTNPKSIMACCQSCSQAESRSVANIVWIALVVTLAGTSTATQKVALNAKATDSTMRLYQPMSPVLEDSLLVEMNDVGVVSTVLCAGALATC